MTFVDAFQSMMVELEGSGLRNFSVFFQSLVRSSVSLRHLILSMISISSSAL